MLNADGIKVGIDEAARRFARLQARPIRPVNVSGVKCGIFFVHVLVNVAGLADAIMGGNMGAGIVKLLVNTVQAAFANVDDDGFRLEAGGPASLEIDRGATNEYSRHALLL